MGIIPILAAAGITYIGDSRVDLTPQAAKALGIEFEAINQQIEYQHPYPLFSFDVNLGSLQECNLDGVSIELLSETGELIFSSGLDSRQGVYHFQLIESALESASLLIHCDTGPDTMDFSYSISLKEHIQAHQENV